MNSEDVALVLIMVGFISLLVFIVGIILNFVWVLSFFTDIITGMLLKSVVVATGILVVGLIIAAIVEWRKF